MTKRQYGDYYLGLDIGTNSVGWAVTDMDYNILRFNSKAMWGVHLFEEGKSSEERRMHRCSRRRLERRKQRISLLRELFDYEVSSVDSGFFARMDESNLITSDRKTIQTNPIFNDVSFKDKDYHKKFPTIYHLRKYLMETDEKPDIRLLYLAIHHIIKYRGHFLFEGLSDNELPDFDELFTRLLSELSAEMNIDFGINENIISIKELIQKRNISLSEKKAKMAELLGTTTKQQKAFSDLLSGSLLKLSALFPDNDSKDIADVGSISLKDSSLEEKRAQLESLLDDSQLNILDLMKSVYGWGVLSGLLSGCSSLSEAKIRQYEQHRRDLSLLKTVLKAYAVEHSDDYTLYNEILKSNEANNYCAYSGMTKGSKMEPNKTCTQEDFCKYLKKKLSDFDFNRNDATKDMEFRINEGIFMPKLRTKDNSILPNALNRKELSAILSNMSRFYPFLDSVDGKGKSVKEKIMSICSFRIPYYVGPLNPKSGNAWICRSSERIYPWNFEEVVDIDRTSRNFIERLISRCSQLVGEKVLPKSSIMYQRFMLYNEINAICINGERISPEMKKELVDELFLKKQAPVTKKKIAEFVTSRTGVKDVVITGVDEKIASSLKTEVRLREILGDAFKDRRLVEDIIRVATIFGDERKRLESKLKDYSKVLSKDQIKQLSKMKFRDWGNLSEKLLIGIYSPFPDGREMNILTAMEQTGNNLMELLSDRFDYKRQIDVLNQEATGGVDDKITYSMVENLYCSPSVKHSIWRTLAVIKDIVKITGHPPKKVFIETTREKRDDGRKTSRKDMILQKYRNLKDSSSFNEIIRSLESTDNARLRSEKLFAYYMQNGRCIYCGKHIDLNDIGNNQICDKDHIYPQSITKDDSINNTVLSCRDCNITKSNRYPISEDIQDRMGDFWKFLKDNDFMSAEKYGRLTRRSSFTDEEKNKFIARQLVETSQSVKATAEVLKKVFGKESDIVYVKGGNVSDFRNEFKDRGFYTKSRNVNDLHHAKDAYLNIVVGNVYDTKFTKDPMHIIRTEQYNIGKMFERNVSRNGVDAWVSGEDGTIRTVDKNMKRDNILFTRNPHKTTGAIFDLNPLRKGKGQHPLKRGLDIGIYGGYNMIAGSHFALVEHTMKGKRVRSIEFVSIMDAKICNDSEKIQRVMMNKGLVEPSVLIPVIKIDSLIELNGFRMMISGRSGDRLIMKNAEQLILSSDSYRYCKKISKYKENSKSRANGCLKPEDFGINQDDNRSLFEELKGKLSSKYKDMPAMNSVKKVIENGFDSFNTLPLAQQVDCLNNIIQLFDCNASYSDLTMIGGDKNMGKIRISNKMSATDEVLLVHQSPSGLFETKIDMNRI